VAKEVSLFAFVIDFGATRLGPSIPEIRLSGHFGDTSRRHYCVTPGSVAEVTSGSVAEVTSGSVAEVTPRSAAEVAHLFPTGVTSAIRLRYRRSNF